MTTKDVTVAAAGTAGADHTDRYDAQPDNSGGLLSAVSAVLTWGVRR